MATVDPTFAQWLQDQASFVLREDAAAKARWGNGALTAEVVTAIATQAAAEAEGDRQLAFFARGPFAIDLHDVVGTDWGSELGRVVTLTINELGYDNGVDVFVIGIEPDRSTGITTLTTLRPLRGVA